MKKTIRSQIMDFVQAAGQCTRSQIVEFLRVYIQGKTYDKVRDRGYYSCAFWDRHTEWPHYDARRVKRNFGYLLHPMPNDGRYLEKDAAKHIYRVVK